MGAELQTRDLAAGAAGDRQPALRRGGVAVWLLGGSTGWLIAALLVGAVVPFTFGVIMPTNHKLLAPGRDLASDETRALLVRWGQLHAVRTALSLAGAAIDLWLMLQK